MFSRANAGWTEGSKGESRHKRFPEDFTEMLRTAVLAAVAASASAFMPTALPTATRRATATSSLKMQERSIAMPFLSAPPALDGTMAGDVGFDPLGFSNYFDLKWLREAELKHGRICMLGCLGFLTQEKVGTPP
jgi:hypothetical protein